MKVKFQKCNLEKSYWISFTFHLTFTVLLVLLSQNTSGECARNKTIWRDRRGLTDVPSDIPDDATLVHLEWNSITSLESGDFSNLHECSVLLLHANSISSIDSGSFQGLNGLLELDLSDNSLSNLEEGTFVGLDSIEELLLYFNRTPMLFRKACGRAVSL